VYLLDTHVLFWWTAEPARLAPAQRRALNDAESSNARLSISAISLWELAMLVTRGRIEVSAPLDIWLAELESDPAIAVIPITARVAFEAVRLGPGFPADPADRIIAATAICHGLTLLTADRRIRDAGEVPVL
jgi:PIN domain nuclease of toxin-antitoxin system